MNITKASARSWARLGQRATFFAIAMPEIVDKNDDIRILTADLAQLSNLDRIINKYPDRIINVGIAEQNMVAIASGMAMEGYSVFATTYASFLAVRSLEQARQHLSQLNLNVKLIATSTGVVAARSGIAHWATEDIAFMRALPNMIVMNAADCVEAYWMANYAASVSKPMYIRLNGTPGCPMIYDETFEFKPGKIQIYTEGHDVALLATGLMVHEAIECAKVLETYGISCTVADVHTIKPLDKTGLDDIFATHKMIATIEEHNVIGGLGSAVAEYKTTLEQSPKQILIGIPDCFTKDTGSQRYIWEQFGLTAPQIAERIKNEFEGKI